jgi:hypothetical protein
MGDSDACEKFVESANLARKIGNKRQMYSCYSELAHVLRENGELEEPLAIYRDLLPKWKDLGHRAAVAHELECIAYILMKKQRFGRAAMLLGAAESLRNMIDAVPTLKEQAEYEKEVAALRERIQDSEFKTAWEKGQKLNMDEVIALATKDD